MVKQYLGGVRQWHWISSAICLAAMLLFAVTGITLNNAAYISSKPSITTIETTLSQPLLAKLQEAQQGALPKTFIRYLQQYAIYLNNTQPEWSEDELYLSLPQAGGDAWLSVDLQSGELFYEQTRRGLIAYANDLHKGRHTGLAWSWFIDIFALACVVFSISGFILLFRHARHRNSTWPLVGLGVLVPFLLILLFVH